MATLAQIVLLLSSSVDGECLAAARALDRALAGEGRDWHWFAQCVADCPHRQKMQSERKADPLAGWDAWDPCDIAAELLRMATAGRLSAWEREFLDGMTLWDGDATDRQDAVLRRIALKLGWRQ